MLNKFVKLTTSKLFILIIWIVIFAFACYTRFGTINYYHGFLSDQGRDALVISHMKDTGQLITLGPASSQGNYSLPPLYYYLISPTVYLSDDPKIQVIPNAVFSFSTIFLFGLLVYFVVKDMISDSKVRSELLDKLLLIYLPILSSIWWLCLVNDVILADVEWNPTPIPFFTISLLLLSYIVLKRSNPSLYLWILLGLVTAIGSNLHSTTLMIFPIQYLITVAYKMMKDRKSSVLGALASLLIIFLLHIPYIYAEIQNHFVNSLNLIKQLFASSNNEIHTFDDLLNNFGRTLYYLFSKYLIPKDSLDKFSLSLGSGLLLFVITESKKLFKGNVILKLSASIFLIYMVFATMYFGDIHFHYQYLITILVMLYFIILLRVSINSRNLLLGICVISFIAISIGINYKQTMSYIDNQFTSQDSLFDTVDMNFIIDKVPNDSNVCLQDNYNAFHSSIEYIVKLSNKDIKINKECANGFYMIKCENKIFYIIN